MIQIKLTKVENIPLVFELYDFATAFQQKVGTNNWKGFEVSMVESEIEEKRHYVIWENNCIAATFVLAFSDPIIWKEANDDPSVYIHRIATHPDFRGRNYVEQIVNWVKILAKEKRLQYIRLDTTSGNNALNKYYIKRGFTYKGVSEIEWDSTLPEHYKGGSFALFEIKI